MISLRLREPQ